MDSDTSDSERRVKDRVDLNRKVQLRFDKFQEFLTEIAGNISPGGMFVRTNSPHAPGEQFEFECSLADGFPLVSGRAEVVWVRPETTDPEPAGMGVRFLVLMDNSESLIRRIVEERIGAGEEPFDLGAHDPAAKVAVDRPDLSLPEEILAASESLVDQGPAADLLEVADASPFETEGPDAFETGDIETLDFFSESEEQLQADDVLSPSESNESVQAPTETLEASDVKAEASVAPPDVTTTLDEADSGRASEATPSRPAAPPEAPASEAGMAVESEASTPPDAAKEPEQLPTPSRGVAPLPVPASLREPAPEAVVMDSPSAGSAAGVGRARPARKRLGVGRFLELVVFSLLAGLCMILVFNQFWVRPRILGLEAKLEELTGDSRIGRPPGFKRALEAERKEASEEGQSVAATVGSASDPDQESTPEVDVVRPPGELVPQAVQSWAKAWSEQRVEEYLACYTEDFKPASGATRSVWEARRRDRLLAQGAIRVAVVSLDTEEISPTEMRVTFTQSYQSDTFRDRVRKTLRLRWVDGAWKIAEEIVVRKLPW